MKIFYIANSRIPTEKAHGIQIIKMCEAFADAGCEVELIVPRRRNAIKQGAFEYYKVKDNFKITRLFCLDLVGVLPRLGFLIEALTFALSVKFYLGEDKKGVVYSRDEFSLYLLSFSRKNIFWESHTAQNSFFTRRLLKTVAGLIAISKGLKNYYESQGAKNVVIAPDAVDLKEFEQVSLEKSEIREKLGLPLVKKIAMYIGHFHKGKGVEILLEASQMLDDDVRVAVIGGTDEEIKYFKNKFPKAIFLGYIPYEKLAENQRAADVLIIPNSAETKIYSLYTSPLKLFAYMASGKPIVASSVPAILEILNEKNAVLVQPGSATALAEGIKRVLSDTEFAGQIAQQARLDVANYTWEKRAESILEFIK